MNNKPGFLAYGPEHLRKVNAQRLANSQVLITSIPTLTKGQVLFSPASSAHNQPRSCMDCWMWNATARSCKLMGPQVRVERFIYPPVDTTEAKRIEYWPVCGMFDYGAPHVGQPLYKEQPFDNPDDLGFGWINAPEPGQVHGGSNCGGCNGGDDCDSYMVSGDDKRASPVGFCRVLRQNVDNGDCCAAWSDDDWVTAQTGQDLLKDLDQRRLATQPAPNPLLPK